MINLKHHVERLLAGLVLLLLASVAANAQSVTGSISGVVVDSNRGVIAGAKVTLISEQTKAPRDLSSSEDGRFSFAALQPGIYTIKIEHAGFQILLKQKVVLSANESLALGDLLLQPGQVSETVTVTSEGAVVERESSDLTGRLTADQIDLISTKGRDITSLLRLLPGTSNDDDIEAAGEGFGTNLPNISGQRGRSTVTTVDGLNASEPSGSNKISMTTSQDAIAEVKVLRNNYAAEYGNNGGALITIVSKGGSKDYRGTAYYFIRNEGLNANSFFNNKAGLKRGLYRHNIPGGNIGGPLPLPWFGEGGPSLLKKKAFFFVNIEKPHTITPTSAVFVTVPTALERQGDFSKSYTGFDSRTGLPTPVSLNDPPRAPGTSPIVGNIIPRDRWNANGLALLNAFPLPNAPFARTQRGDPYNYVFQQSVDVPKHSYLVRFDVKPTNKDSVYWKYQWWTSDNEGLGTSGWPSGDANRWGISSHYLYTDNGWSANWVHLVSSSVVNEFNVGMRQDSEGFIPSDGIPEKFSRATTGYNAAQLFPLNNHLGLIPRVTDFGNVPGTPANINWLDRWGEVGHDFIRPSFADNLSITRGNHSYKFGAYFERLLNGEAPGGNWTGTFNFSNNSNSSQFTTAAGNANFGYANALLGNFRTYSESSARPHTNLEIKLFQWYGQDQWKVNRRLTLNYGMRLSYHSPFVQVDGQASNFDPTKFDPANAPVLYVAFCKGGTPAFGTACSSSNQFAVDPRVANPSGSQLLNRNLVRSFIPGTGSLTNGLVLGTDPNTPRGFRKAKSIDFEPRLGLAWDISGKGTTVLRMHGGVYHAPRIGGGTTGGNLVNNPPQSRTFTINTAVGTVGNIDNIVNLKDVALNFPGSLNAIEVNSKTPTTYNLAVGVQRDLGFKTVMEVSYVGSFTRHLGERRNMNAVPDGARFVDPSQCALFHVTCHPENRDPIGDRGAKNNDFLRPYRGYGDINMVMYSGTANYNSLQMQINRRYTKGFQYGVAYTYSKSFDYANDDSSDVNNGRPYRAFNYGPSDFDQTHIFTVNYIYDLPRLSRHWDNSFTRGLLDNWQISGTTSFASGKPKDIGVTYSSTSFDILRSTGVCPAGTVRTQNSQAKAGDPLTDKCNPITDWTGGQINALPFIVCDPMKGSPGVNTDGTPIAFNTACITAPNALGQIGNQPRNALRRPSIFNTDLAIFKNIRLGERRAVQLRFETYNLFNRANFSDLDAGWNWGLVGDTPTVFTRSDGSTLTTYNTAHYEQTNSRFGAVTATRSPRVMQASIRVNF